jgi:DNA modification methylase
MWGVCEGRAQRPDLAFKEFGGKFSVSVRFSVASSCGSRLPQDMSQAGAQILAESLDDDGPLHPASLTKLKPAYATNLGAAYATDSLKLLASLPDKSVNAVITSPPYALHFKKEYGNASKEDYVDWLLPFARKIKEKLTDDGSFVLNIGGSYNSGSPTRSVYHFKLLVKLVEEVGFHLAQECFWYNPAKLPAPAEWVNVRRSRIKDSVEYIWWLSPSPNPKADNKKVLTPYSGDMLRLIEKGYKAKKRPSGHNITHKFRQDHGGAIPPNLIIRGNNESNSDYIRACKELGIKVHPARFPAELPRFFINLLTEPDDIVLDPFAGSNTTGKVAEELGRRWLSVDIDKSYVKASEVRFKKHDG